MYGSDAKVMGQGGMQGAALGGGYSNMAAEGSRRPELAGSVDKLNQAVCFVEESLNELTKRLDGVLRPCGPEPAQTAQQIQPAPPVSSYAAQVYEQAQRTTRLCERLQDILRRLEA